MENENEEELSFKAVIQIIGANPYIFVPDNILKEIFIRAGKDRGPIPIYGKINGKDYRQTLVKYKGLWRLYINTGMLSHSPEHIGETVSMTINHDTRDRSIIPHPKLIAALNENPEAKKTFDELSVSRKNEIIRYIYHLKSEESKDQNIKRAVSFLLGKERFVGRDHPV